MASWKLFWLSYLPSMVVVAYLLCTFDVQSDGRPADPTPVDVTVALVGVFASLVLWGTACDALARERCTRTSTRLLTTVSSFFVPFIFVAVFLIFPNRTTNN